MTETEQVSSTESTPDRAVIASALPEVRESTESPSSDSKPAGYEPIDPVTATPEQTQERLDYLYRQVKTSDREKREMRNILSDQSKLINELSEGQKVVVNHLTQKSFSDSKEQLKTAMQDAWKKGDNVAYIDAQNRLMDIQVEERIAAKTQPQQPQQQPDNGYRPSNAVDSGELSENDYRTTESWQNERDEAGNLVRPWAYATDPSHQAALFETRSVLANPRFQNLSYEQKLAEVDKRMGITKKLIHSP